MLRCVSSIPCRSTLNRIRARELFAVSHYNSTFIVNFAIFCSFITGVSNAGEVWDNCSDIKAKAYYEQYPPDSQLTLTSWMIPYKVGSSVDTQKTINRFADRDGQGLGTPWTKCVGLTERMENNSFTCQHLLTGNRFLSTGNEYAHNDYPDRNGNFFTLKGGTNLHRTTRNMCKRGIRVTWTIFKAVHSTDSTEGGNRPLPYIYVDKVEYRINRTEGFSQGPSF